jgi:putative SOS response-associated peptidase YedK
VIDSQSVKTTEAGGPRGYDAGKKVKGRKRHILTDTLGVEHRCLVPFTSFAEIDGRPGAPRNHPVWFALAPDRPLAFFAGPRTEWTSVRKVKEGEVTAELFAFLTCAPNCEVGAVHPRAMPVILTRPDEWRQWLTAPTAQALTLQRPLPDGALEIVLEGAREDAA